ncbi:RHS repeat-associated core domain-containing protein [Schleiferia thermophila]|uniref:RHS repeat-associated core domain-containing protein n=1 Tax=Schleiferia thermophila TaxID=884107 RepID=UPI003F504AFB
MSAIARTNRQYDVLFVSPGTQGMGHPGHVEYVTDGAGVPYQYFHYSPWGESLISQTRTPNSTDFSTPYRFNAKELDSESGLFYYGARYYHPMVSKWLGVDPLADHPSQIDKSPYTAFWNNPIIFTDPDGRCVYCPDPSTAKEGDIVNPLGGWDFILTNGEWTAIGGMLGEVTVTAPRSESNGGFGSGFVDGFGAGIGSTVDFFASLGTTQGWKDLGQGILDMAMLGCQTCPQGMMMRAQMADRIINYMQNIPNMSAYEMGYDLGFGTEKALEIAVTRGVYTGSGVGIGSVRMLSNTSLRGTTLFKTGKNFRIDLDLRNGLHYHRRGPGGIGRHRPWQVKPGDQGDFWKRF